MLLVFDFYKLNYQYLKKNFYQINKIEDPGENGGRHIGAAGRSPE